ncbi:MAG: hypothetical protein BGO49_24690 [Planctomycetales bacterium 71-10]|nr:MAG: hypothetical protein BGO49_24690 [Planctomycetales bacterium 71-10]
MKNYFFNNRFVAAYMAEQYGVRYWGDKPGHGAYLPNEEILEREIVRVHPDSLPLFDPRIGDMVRVAIEGNVFDWLGMMVDDKEDVERYAAEQVILREGKPFHWPHAEAA